ncbi:MAG: hypothetical protein HOB79_09600 [Rhodospirillaceae bacterium]|nr:hypothetical protein [Rhodospirillaceae bacterium]
MKIAREGARKGLRSVIPAKTGNPESGETSKGEGGGFRNLFRYRKLVSASSCAMPFIKG